MEFETAKLASESWVEYVQRLVDRHYLTEQDKEKWASGKSGKWTRRVQVTNFDVTLRVRLIEKVNRQIEKVFGVQIPVAEYVKGTLLLPKPGKRPDDVEFDGFLDLSGNPIVTQFPKLSQKELRRRERELKKRTPSIILKKSSNESPSQFVERLVREKMMTGTQRKKWQAGHLVSITVREKQTVLIPQTQIQGNRQVTNEIPVQRTKTIEVPLPDPKDKASPRKKK